MTAILVAFLPDVETSFILQLLIFVLLDEQIKSFINKKELQDLNLITL